MLLLLLLCLLQLSMLLILVLLLLGFSCSCWCCWGAVRLVATVVAAVAIPIALAMTVVDIRCELNNTTCLWIELMLWGSTLPVIRTQSRPGYHMNQVFKTPPGSSELFFPQHIATIEFFFAVLSSQVSLGDMSNIAFSHYLEAPVEWDCVLLPTRRTSRENRWKQTLSRKKNLTLWMNQIALFGVRFCINI